ncbi:MAG: hypothetical protein D4R39_03295 [Methylophilaceae bacterium]|nr:MAG: hypothetical protein D4R39_03295 [Methylophilaceae bacterium]
MTTLQKTISDVQAGEYVDLDIATAYDVICQTQLLGTDWNVFLDHAPNAVLNTEFRPRIDIRDLRGYVLRELKKPEDEEPVLDRVICGIDSVAIYLQKYEIEVEGTKGKISIWRTPTKTDFDRARAVILFVLEFFRQAQKGEKFVATVPNPEITMTIRSMEKFYDINIQSGINKEAWIAFDFRDVS